MSDQEEAQLLRERYAACLEMGLDDEAAMLAEDLGLTAAEVASHLRARGHVPEGLTQERFDDFAALPPGRFDRRVFDQTTWWVDILRRPHRISDRDDFTDEHLLAVIAFVQEEAWRWANFPELGDDDLVSEEWFFREAVARIRQTPLFQALSTEAQRRMLSPPEC